MPNNKENGQRNYGDPISLENDVIKKKKDEDKDANVLS